MGIEPTGRMVNTRPNGFEDRGHHQVCKHFRLRLPVRRRRAMSQSRQAAIAALMFHAEIAGTGHSCARLFLQRQNAPRR